jgi:uncharacterized glyoxalase superfamily protein PhnB
MTIGLWQTLRCKDADAEIAWLTAIGFTEHGVFRSDDDPKIVEHAQLVWSGGGGVMLGSERDTTEWKPETGKAGTYLVTDDPAAVYEAALAAGATSMMEPTEQHYGGTNASVRDPEGNLWSFGDYAPI